MTTAGCHKVLEADCLLASTEAFSDSVDCAWTTARPRGQIWARRGGESSDAGPNGLLPATARLPITAAPLPQPHARRGYAQGTGSPRPSCSGREPVLLRWLPVYPR